MAEEIRIEFGGEVQERVGPELTQAFDNLARSIETAVRQPTQGNLPIIRPTQPAVQSQGLVVPWFGERREWSPQAPSVAPKPQQPGASFETLDVSQLAIPNVQRTAREKFLEQAVKTRIAADDESRNYRMSPAERVRLAGAVPEEYGKLEKLRSEYAGELWRQRPERGGRERVSPEEFERRVQEAASGLPRGTPVTSSVRANIERSIRQRAVPWGGRGVVMAELAGPRDNWQARIRGRRNRRNPNRNRRAAMLRMVPKRFRGAAARVSGRMGGQFSQQAAGVAGSMVGGIVGAGTGSPTMGAMAGMGAMYGMTMAPELAPVVIAGAILAETFRTLDKVVHGAAENLKTWDARVATAYAMRDVAMVQYRLQQRGEIGGISAQYVEQQTRLNIEWERFKTELVKGFGEDVIDFKEAVIMFVKLAETFLSLINDFKGIMPEGTVQTLLSWLTMGSLGGFLDMFTKLGHDVRKIQDNTKKDEYANLDPVTWAEKLLGQSDKWGGGAAFKPILQREQPALSIGKWG